MPSFLIVHWLYYSFECFAIYFNYPHDAVYECFCIVSLVQNSLIDHVGYLSEIDGIIELVVEMEEEIEIG